MSKQCFVIQPFDKGDFDKRYNEIYKPAIEQAGLVPYRVDMDPSVRVPIEQIEEGIQESAICFADISLDNPNVWYELGYAFACRKDVVMVCSSARQDFPFDIRHKTITRYQTGSISDFHLLTANITERLIAYLSEQKGAPHSSSAVKHDVDDLAANEITILKLLMENQLADDDFVFPHFLCSEMERAGFERFEATVAMRTLELRGRHC